MENLSLLVIWAIFLVAGAVTWFAGITLAKATDTLDTRWKIGDALGGLVLLGITGSLPEIAVVWSAAAHGHIPVIIGNLVGGLSIQTLIIVIFDMAVKGKKPLSYHAGSYLLLFETLFAIVIAGVALGGMYLSPNISIFHMSPMSIGIVVVWVAGLFFINKERTKPTVCAIVAEECQPGRRHHQRRAVENHPFYVGKSSLYVIAIFLFVSALTLAAGVLLEETGTMIADKMNIGSGIFAATAIALITSLPEISTGLESIFMGDHHLAISDIMGGNAFMLVVFIMADLVAKQPVLAYAQRTDMLLTILGIVMMGVYAFSFVHPPQRRFLRMGWDSVWQIGIYIAGMFGFNIVNR